MKLYELTASQLEEKLIKKEITSNELLKCLEERIEEKDKDLKAFVTKTFKEARNLEKEVNGNIGVPIGIKDNVCTKNIRTTCSSKMLENFVPVYNATIIEKINKQNMPIMGKLNMDEFAMGGTTETSAFFDTRNPWDLSKVPGGSSGGSAASVASDMVPWAIGSDTGGSIRQPASYCGIVGLKPTYGLVSRYGVVAMASSLDQVGTLTKDVKDSAKLLNIIAGHDARDTTSVQLEKIDYTKSLINDVKGLKIGVPKEFFAEGINEEVKLSVMNAVKKYEELGAIIEEFSLDIADISLATYHIISCAEASSNLGRFDGIRYGYRTKNFNSLKDIYKNSRSEGFGKEVKRRIILGTYVLSSGFYDAYYKKACAVRNSLKNQFAEAFKKYDIILTPSAPTTATKIGEKPENPIESYLTDLYTTPVNITGVPGISIPCGVDKDGMPIGLQLIAKHFDEDTLFKAAYTYEQATNFRQENKPTFKGGK